MLLPSIQAMRGAFPEASIDFLTLESNREALTIIGAVNGIRTIDTRSPRAFIRTWRSISSQLRREHYDLIIDFEQFARFSALLTDQIGAETSIGFITKGQHRHLLYTHGVHYDNEIHITRSFYSLVARAGVTAPFSPEIVLPNIAKLRERGHIILQEFGISPELPIAILHIGTSENFKDRRWAPRNYAELAERLRDLHGFQIILTGLPDESHLIRMTRQNLRSEKQILDLGGRLSFADYFALFTAADIVVSADTAAVHLASAVQTPVVGLYGPNTPKLYGPWGRHCSALYAAYPCSPCITNFNGKINTCRHPDGRGACMAAVSVDMVHAAIENTYLRPDAPHRLGKTPVRLR
jgi:ADP-heptose:LPS heptosyltransferase